MDILSRNQSESMSMSSRLKKKTKIMEELEMSTTTTTVLLPQDILMDILSRLPVETLLTSFKLVCKAWRTIIKDHYFVNMHLNQRGGGGRRISNSNDNSNSSLYCKSGNTLYQLHPPFNYDDDGVPPPNAAAAAKELDFDLGSSISRLVGSCNGLLCIRVFHQNIIILNPSTRKYKVLPEEPKLVSHGPFIISTEPVTYGFGCCYNNNNNDYEYKLVRIAYFYPAGSLFIGSNFEFQIDIYSMSSNSWKMTRRGGIKDFPALIFRYRPAIFLNGALHWTGSIRHGFGDLRNVLVSFDLRDEDYRLIAMPPQPSCTTVDKPRDKILINLRGCLGIIFVSRCWDFGIWVMKEYGIRESWTRECVIRYSNTNPPGALSEFQPWWTEFQPWWTVTACFLKGDQILIDIGCHGRMVLYDMNSKKIDGDFKMVGIPREAPIAGVNYNISILDLADYIETLVSPKSSQLPSFEQQQLEEKEWWHDIHCYSWLISVWNFM